MQRPACAVAPPRDVVRMRCVLGGSRHRFCFGVADCGHGLFDSPPGPVSGSPTIVMASAALGVSCRHHGSFPASFSPHRDLARPILRRAHACAARFGLCPRLPDAEARGVCDPPLPSPYGDPELAREARVAARGATTFCVLSGPRPGDGEAGSGPTRNLDIDELDAWLDAQVVENALEDTRATIEQDRGACARTVGLSRWRNTSRHWIEFLKHIDERSKVGRAEFAHAIYASVP